VRTLSRQLGRGVACLSLVAASAALGVPAAGAEAARSATIKPDQTNWFWAEQTSGRENPVTHTGTPALDPSSSGVPRGDLGVSNAQGVSPEGAYAGPDKEPLISWDLSAYSDVTVTSFKSTFFIDPAAQNLPPNAAPKLVGCVAKEDWGNGAGEDILAKPKLDCATPLVAKYDAKARSYTLDLTGLAQRWVDGEFNYGVSLRAPAGEPEFTLSLLRKDATGVNKIPTVFTFTPKAPLATAPSAGAAGTTTTAGSGSTASSGSSDLSSFNGGTLTAPTDSGSPGSVSAPELAAPAPAPAPALAAPAPAPAAAPIAVRPLAVSTRPSGAFWVAGLLLAALLGFASLVLGAGAGGLLQGAHMLGHHRHQAGRQQPGGAGGDAGARLVGGRPRRQPPMPAPAGSAGAEPPPVHELRHPTDRLRLPG